MKVQFGNLSFKLERDLWPFVTDSLFLRFRTDRIPHVEHQVMHYYLAQVCSASKSLLLHNNTRTKTSNDVLRCNKSHTAKFKYFNKQGQTIYK